MSSDVLCSNHRPLYLKSSILQLSNCALQPLLYCTNMQIWVEYSTSQVMVPMFPGCFSYYFMFPFAVAIKSFDQIYLNVFYSFFMITTNKRNWLPHLLHIYRYKGYKHAMKKEPARESWYLTRMRTAKARARLLRSLPRAFTVRTHKMW